jgi:hypothetical protein
MTSEGADKQLKNKRIILYYIENNKNVLHTKFILIHISVEKKTYVHNIIQSISTSLLGLFGSAKRINFDDTYYDLMKKAVIHARFVSLKGSNNDYVK